MPDLYVPVYGSSPEWTVMTSLKETIPGLPLGTLTISWALGVSEWNTGGALVSPSLKNVRVNPPCGLSSNTEYPAEGQCFVGIPSAAAVNAYHVHLSWVTLSVFPNTITRFTGEGCERDGFGSLTANLKSYGPTTL